jgi:1,4-dihydroxy-2-naphthoate octaprenyltransferase
MLLTGFMSSILYVYLTYSSPYQYAFIVVLPLLAIHLTRLKRANTSAEVDPLLKQLAMTTLLFCVTFGLGGCF